MRISDRSGSGRRLQTIFIPATPKPVFPSEISDEIVLTHPAVPPMVSFKEGRFFNVDFTGSAGATSVASSLVPTDRYWWIEFADIFHDDTVTDRRLELSIRDTQPKTVGIMNNVAAIGPGIRLALPRAIILPNDTQLVATVDAIGGAFAVHLRFFFYELLHAEVNPTA